MKLFYSNNSDFKIHLPLDLPLICLCQFLYYKYFDILCKLTFLTVYKVLLESPNLY